MVMRHIASGLALGPGDWGPNGHGYSMPHRLSVWYKLVDAKHEGSGGKTWREVPASATASAVVVAVIVAISVVSSPRAWPKRLDKKVEKP